MTPINAPSSTGGHSLSLSPHHTHSFVHSLPHSPFHKLLSLVLDIEKKRELSSRATREEMLRRICERRVQARSLRRNARVCASPGTRVGDVVVT